jgi:hypothetical protein
VSSIIERWANEPVLALLARLMQVVVLPVLVWLFLQLWNGLIDARTEFRTIDHRITVLETRLEARR